MGSVWDGREESRSVYELKKGEEYVSMLVMGRLYRLASLFY
jgi:hypothetical protein